MDSNAVFLWISRLVGLFEHGLETVHWQAVYWYWEIWSMPRSHSFALKDFLFFIKTTKNLRIWCQETNLGFSQRGWNKLKNLPYNCKQWIVVFAFFTMPCKNWSKRQVNSSKKMQVSQSYTKYKPFHLKKHRKALTCNFNKSLYYFHSLD